MVCIGFICPSVDFCCIDNRKDDRDPYSLVLRDWHTGGGIRLAGFGLTLTLKSLCMNLSAVLKPLDHRRAQKQQIPEP